MKQRGGGGAFLDAYAWDTKALKEMHFPLFFRGTDPQTSKGRCEINECKVPVEIEGVTIHHGDLIFSDCDGTVIIPQQVEDTVMRLALETIEKENRVRDNLQNGQSLEKVYTEIGAI